LEILLPLGALLFGSLLYRNTVDKTKGEPLLAEEALVHAKTDHSNRYSSFYTIHFYIAARDTVVTCGVPEQIWHLLKKGQRGILRSPFGQDGIHLRPLRRRSGIPGQGDEEINRNSRRS
jgi:hypothetical protein